MVGVNPTVQFEETQITAILDEVFEAYASFIEAPGGLSMEGLTQTYDDGAGDVDHDYDALGFNQPDGARVSPREALVGQALAMVKGGIAEDAWHQTLREVGGLGKADAFEAYMAIGTALQGAGQSGKALQMWNKALSLQPRAARAHFRLGNTHFTLSNLEEARRGYEQALECMAEGDRDLVAKTHVNMGVTFEYQGYLFAACDCYRSAIAEDPRNFRAHKLLGSAYVGLGEFEAAEASLAVALDISPEFVDAHCDLGVTQKALGKRGAARESFARAVELDEAHIEALYNLANLEREEGAFAAGSGLYRRVIRKRPKHWRAHLNLALCLMGEGDGASAQEALEAALETSGKRVECYDVLQELKLINKAGGLKDRLSAEDKGKLMRSESQVFESMFKKSPSKKARGQGIDGDHIQRELKRAGVADPERLTAEVDIKLLQQLAPLTSCPVQLVRQQARDMNVRTNGIAKEATYPACERVAKAFVPKLPHTAFQALMKALNTSIFAKVKVRRSGATSTLDLGLVLACLAPLCEGPGAERLQAAYEILAWKCGTGKAIPRGAALGYLELLNRVYKLPEAAARAGAGNDVLAAAADDQDLMGPVEFGQVAKSAGQGFDAFDVLPLFAKRQGWNLTPGGSPPNKKLFG